MKAALFALAALPLLSGCAVLQGSYDNRADEECRDLPNTEDRVACQRAVQEAEIKRRAEARD